MTTQLAAVQEAPASLQPGLPASTRDGVWAQVERQPDAVAVCYEAESWTYRTLRRRTDQLSHALGRACLIPESRVGVHLRRGPDLVASFLAVHQWAAAYVPLDPHFPADRLQYMAADAGLAAILTDGPLGFALPPGVEVIWVGDAPGPGPEQGLGSFTPRTLHPENLAYVIYTSGSTGKPKGVQISHASLARFLRAMAQRPGFGPQDVLLAVTTTSFDIAGLELFLPLLTGGRLVIAPAAVTGRGEALADLLRTRGANVLQATPVTWKLLLQAGWQGQQGLKALCGGEALSRPLAEQLLPRVAELWNLYGPTETTIWSTVARVRSGTGPVELGEAIGGTAIRIVDPDGEPCSAGQEGQLTIGGEGLARGYWRRPAATADRFRPSAFSAAPGQRLYLTGDLARPLVSGGVEFLGRLDRQVKIRGFRIELGEIEAILISHPDVADGVVLAVPTPGGEPRLVAWLVPASGSMAAADRAVDLNELRAHLAAKLPAYMCPASYRTVAAFPLTPNRKIDRQALIAGLSAEEPEGIAGSTELEDAVLQVWRQILGDGAIVAADDFFQVGGHSLLVGRLMAALSARLEADLPPSLIFEATTPARLSLAIDDFLSQEGNVRPPLSRQETGEAACLSFAQERMWLHDQLDPGNNAFHIAHALRLRGALSLKRLDGALARLLERHEVLRSRFVLRDGGPRALIDPLPPAPARVLDLQGLPAARKANEAQRLLERGAAASFALAAGELVRFLVLRLEEAEALFGLVLHHILADGGSLGILSQELTTLYAAGPAVEAPEASSLAPLEIQYADYARWQRQLCTESWLEEQLKFWHGELAPFAERGVPLLPTDGDRGAPRGPRRSLEIPLSASLVAGLKEAAERQAASSFMVFLASLHLLIARCTGAPWVVAGALSGRRPHPRTEDLIGLFVTTLPIPAAISAADSFSQLLSQGRTRTLQAFAHQEVPMDRVTVGSSKGPSKGPARGGQEPFQVLLIDQSQWQGELRLDGVEAEAYPIRSEKIAAFDLCWTVLPATEGLRLALEYDSARYRQETAERLLGYFAALLRDVAAGNSRPVGEWPGAWREVAGGALREDGRLWLTDGPSPKATAASVDAGPMPGVEDRKVLAAQLKAEADTKKSRLSAQKLALLRQRLKK